MPRILQDGNILNRQHTVERFLGEGAFAEVYRVKHRVLGRQAMKVFKQPIRGSDRMDKLLAEAILLSRIGHPNIVRVFDAGTFEQSGELYGYMTMEYVGGGTLHDVWQAEGAVLMSAVKAVDLVRQAAMGLSIAHQSDPPVIHRDIKPSNILVAITEKGHLAKVSDFGLAREVNPLTLMATGAGTLPFKAPEIFSASKTDSPAADVWSLGVTLYMLLTDEMPFGMAPGEAPQPRHFKQPPAPPSRIHFECDAALDAIVLKALSPDPAGRYSHAGALHDALQSWAPQAFPQQSPEAPAPSSAQSLKTILPAAGSSDREHAAQLVKAALTAASQGALSAAAETLEEAFTFDPSLRNTHESRVRLWRMGVAM